MPAEGGRVRSQPQAASLHQGLLSMQGKPKARLQARGGSGRGTKKLSTAGFVGQNRAKGTGASGEAF